ncbi:hypothetical protein OG361_19630 [Streptomyces sp. NBC_00090]|uniref:hypothetical protein n=1 Tax=Streptomyces sp. NBC_00090 TaxID=2903619 RepID=UPI003251C30D
MATARSMRRSFSALGSSNLQPRKGTWWYPYSGWRPPLTRSHLKDPSPLSVSPAR